nr:hypothetical protein [Chloroflexota bacterium]
MEYKEDWEQAKEHLIAFWNGSAIQRATLQIYAPRDVALPGPKPPTTPQDPTQLWTDPDYLIAAADHHFRTQYFGAEAVPSHWINLGPGIMATYLGSRPTFAPDTVWYGPIAYEYERPLLQEEDNRWWQLTKDLTRLSCAFFAGKALTGITDLGGCTDVLASLRTTEALLLDMVGRPEQVQQAVIELAHIWVHCYNELYAMVEENDQGSIQWLGVWAPGKMYNVQSDLSCMISPAMFNSFVVPELEIVLSNLDFALYHLDGPGAIKHLDRLLEIPNLKGIQWTPGEGQPPVSEWIPMYRRIQKAGKLLHLHGEARYAERVLRALEPEGLMYVTWCETQTEAEDLMRKAESWAAGPRRD